MQVNSKIFIYLTLFLTLTFVGCVSPPPRPPEMSEFQIREIQTREYENADYIEAMKAVIASLQDQEFIITNANEKLGLVTAYKDFEEIDRWTQLLVGAQGSYQTIRRIEATAIIKQEGKVIRIRINLVAKGITNTGGIEWTRPIYDPKIYQKIFSKIDKAIFIEKEKIF